MIDFKKGWMILGIAMGGPLLFGGGNEDSGKFKHWKTLVVDPIRAIEVSGPILANVYFDQEKNQLAIEANFKIKKLDLNYKDQKLKIEYCKKLKKHQKIVCTIWGAISSIHAEKGAQIQGKNAFSYCGKKAFSLKALDSSIGLELENVKKLTVNGAGSAEFFVRGEVAEQYVQLANDMTYNAALCQSRYCMIVAQNNATFNVGTYLDEYRNAQIPAGADSLIFNGVRCGLSHGAQGIIKGEMQKAIALLEGQSSLKIMGKLKEKQIECKDEASAVHETSQ